jgi:hypothetical protein
MREDNLLYLRIKPFVHRTTDSRRGLAIRPNLIRSAGPTELGQTQPALPRTTPVVTRLPGNLRGYRRELGDERDDKSAIFG